MESRLSGRIIVTVTNLRDNNSLVTIIEGNIADIIRGIANHPNMGFSVAEDVCIFLKANNKYYFFKKFGIKIKKKELL